MPSFCLIQNHNTRESFMWVGRNTKHGTWFPSGPDEFDGMEEFRKVLEAHEDPHRLLVEMGSLWKKDEEND